MELQQNTIPYRKHDDLTLSESIDIDHTALRMAIDADFIFAICNAAGFIVYVERENAPLEFLAQELPMQEVVRLQAEAKRRFLLQFN